MRRQENRGAIAHFAGCAMTLSAVPNALPGGDTFAAVVLAAGAGSRLGGRPKCLLEWNHQALICRLLDSLSAAGIEEQIIVLGYHAAPIEAAVADRDLIRVHNPAPHADPGSSLHCGLRAVRFRHQHVLIALADQPLIDSADVAALTAAFAKRGSADLLVPRCSGLPGNPVVMTASLAAEWREADALHSGREWREANPERIHWFDTANWHYCVDIDTPEDLASIRMPDGRMLRWPVLPNQTDPAGRH
jgi:molybdenum cofactor cytidylyltransferase